MPDAEDGKPGINEKRKEGGKKMQLYTHGSV
jgi:hypothetical protein